MKIKNWLITSYLIVMITPIIIGIFIFIGINSCNKKEELNDYIKFMNKVNYYEKYVENPNLYTKVQRDLHLLKEEDKFLLKINLYDKYGGKLYSTFSQDMISFLNEKDLYSNLYSIQRKYKTEEIKNPVLLNGDVIGFYQITMARNDVVKNINYLTIIALVIFILALMLVLAFAVYFLNKKINRPVSSLINAMKAYAEGEEDIQINYNKKDEVGDLINHFILMKNDLDKNKKQIEIQQKDKEYLIAAISHDLKTPLTSIRAYGEALMEYKNLSDEEIDHYTSIIINKSDFMKNMLEDLLTYTLLNTKYDLDKVQVEGEEFLEMLFSGYDELCYINNVTLKKEIKVSGIYEVDVKAIIRVIDNLVNNGLRYVPKGGEIFLGAYSSEFSLPQWMDEEIKEKLNKNREDNIIIFVKNDGEPIKKSEQEIIFKAFYQVDDSRNKKGNRGTGLGLSIVRAIIEKHGGKIELISEKDFGTLIAFFIKKVR